MPKTSAQKELEKHWAKQARDAQKRQKQPQGQSQEQQTEDAKKAKAPTKKLD
jgi:hypothetical protein